MRYKLLFLLLMYVSFCQAQDVYKYENLTVTAKSYNKSSSLRWKDNNILELKDSCVEIRVWMNERSVSLITIRNLSSQPMIARWKQFSASNMSYLFSMAKQDPKKYKKFFNNYYNVKVDPTSFVSDRRSGEETIYIDGIRNYRFQWSENDMFPEKLDIIEGTVYLELVINGREKSYIIKLNGVNAKR